RSAPEVGLVEQRLGVAVRLDDVAHRLAEGVVPAGVDDLPLRVAFVELRFALARHQVFGERPDRLARPWRGVRAELAEQKRVRLAIDVEVESKAEVVAVVR